MKKVLITVVFIFAFVSTAFPQNYVSKEILRAHWGSEKGQLGLFYGGPEPTYDFPRDMAIDEKGNIYISDYVNKRVVKFNPSGNYEKNIGETYGDIKSNTFYENIGVDSDDNVYAYDKHNYNIVKFNPSGIFKSVIKVKGTDAGIQMRVNISGDIYINDFISKKKLVKKGGLLGLLGDEAYVAEESDFAYESPGGNVYNFKKVDSKAKFKRIKKVSKGPFGIATSVDATEKDLSATFHANKGDRFIGFDNYDNYYIADYHYNYIRKYDPDGNLIIQLELPKNPGIEGYEFRIVKVDGKGNIYNFLYEDKEAWIVKMEKVAE